MGRSGFGVNGVSDPRWLGRDSRWSESVAVGSIQFAERVKNAMGAIARGRCIRGIKDGFELRESQSA